jgi:thimet oligopeptidase
LAAEAARPGSIELFEALNEASIALDRGFNEARLMSGAHPSEDERIRAMEWLERFAGAKEQIAQSPRIHALVESMRTVRLDAATSRYRSLLERRMRLAGGDLDAPSSARLGVLRGEIAGLERAFIQQIQDDGRGISVEPRDLEGLPEDYVAALKTDGSGRRLVRSVQAERIPFMAHAASEALRRELCEAFFNVGAPENESILIDLLGKRHALSRLLGYSSWAEMALESSMAGGLARVRESLVAWTDALRPQLAQNLEWMLREQKREQPEAQRVEEWQWFRLQQRLKSNELGFDPIELREYFELGRLVEILLETTTDLFALEWQRVSMEVWHPDVRSYDVFQRGAQEPLGRVHLDLHLRDGKYPFAATVPLVTGIRGRQSPEVAVIASFPRGRLEHFQVVHLFHEMGHVLHFLFAAADQWLELGGFEAEEDFLEVPSQLFEEWAWRADVLSKLTRASDRSGPPARMLDRLEDVRRLEEPSRSQKEICFAAVALEYHASPPSGADLPRRIKEIFARFSPFPWVEGTRPDLGVVPLATTHAMHYAYLWSAAIAKPFYGRITHDPHAAARYRDRVLARSPSVPAAELVADFLRSPGPIASGS